MQLSNLLCVPSSGTKADNSLLFFLLRIFYHCSTRRNVKCDLDVIYSANI